MIQDVDEKPKATSDSRSPELGALPGSIFTDEEEDDNANNESGPLENIFAEVLKEENTEDSIK